ncbi:MAG: RtcB family protein [Desulfarculaceae bacterium]|nr:RtcB family protein [Desulfarculaceae bacterium]
MRKTDGKPDYGIWGSDHPDDVLVQFEGALGLPVSVKGALMADAHLGYGLPIGGVLATDNAVIPYAVGVDIACRMKMSILSASVEKFQTDGKTYGHALERETCFGVGKQLRRSKYHRVMDEDWSFCKPVRSLKDKAARQLGTSGSGNHFAEFGILTLDAPELGLPPGKHLAFLTHSGSRGAGASIAKHYSGIAKRKHPELPREINNLAWLDMNSEDGIEYWKAMELMGRYASANHETIHDAVLGVLGERVVATIENHHNFAWKETVDNKELIVHRKGATPAGTGTLGVIPGSMASPAFVVRGRGVQRSICSAAHGAGRKMSRNAAKKKFRMEDLERVLGEKGITLISAGIDEVPMAYKDIETVMHQQKDLVDIIARFDPVLVKMAPSKGK